MSRTLALFLFALTGILGLPQLLYPLWFDQGAFAACADELLRGGAMYINCWEVRGPLTPLLYALARAISASSVSPHALDLIFQWLTACTLSALAWRMFASRTAAGVAGALYIFLYASLNYWATAQAEGFANLFMAIGLLCCVAQMQFLPAFAGFDFAQDQRRSDARNRALAVLSGLCCAALFWLKYPLVTFAVLLLIRTKKRAAFMLALCAGVVFGLALLFAQGALPAWGQHMHYDLATFNNVPFHERWDWFSTLFGVEIKAFVQQGNTPTADWKATVPQVEILGRGFPWLMALLLMSALLMAAARPLRGPRALAWVWLLFGIALNIWQGHSYRYHFVIGLPALAMIAASVWAERNRLQRAIAFAASALTCAGMALTTAPWIVDAWQNIVIERKPLRAIHEESRLREYFALADFLDEHSSPDERIVIFSDVPAIYALSHRSMGTRFPYFRWADEGRALREEYAAQTLLDLQTNTPRFFVLTKERFPWPEADFVNTWKSLPQVNAYVEAHYQYVTDVGNFIIFERR